MTYNAARGTEYILDSRQLADGAYQGTVTATDVNGRSTSVMILVGLIRWRRNRIKEQKP